LISTGGGWKMGRPRNYTDKQVEKFLKLFEEYIKDTDIPIISEFAYLNDLPREIIYDYEEFTTLRKKAINKKEAQLEKLGLLNVVNSSMAIFSLKQLGWSDKQDIEHSGNVKIDSDAIEKYLKK